MPLRAVMLGASGAVGREVMDSLCNKFELPTLTLLNRRLLPNASGAAMEQHIVDVLLHKPTSTCWAPTRPLYAPWAWPSHRL